MKLFSEETLAHYGIQGQKWGERRWQNPDGTFNEAGKERYFGIREKLESKIKEGSESAQGKEDKQSVKYKDKLNKIAQKAISRNNKGKSDMPQLQKAATLSREYTDPKSKYNLLKGIKNGLRNSFGITDNDSRPEKVFKTATGLLSTIIPPAGLYNIMGRIEKSTRNNIKLGGKDGSVKMILKEIILGGKHTDNYNIRRAQGQSTIRSLLGASFVDNVKDLFTLGKASYDRKENLGLEHSNIMKLFSEETLAHYGILN